MDTYLYATADVNMREGYTTDSGVIKVVPYGTKLHVTGVIENWYRIDGEGMGYVFGKYLSAEEPVNQVASQSTAQSQAETSAQTGEKKTYEQTYNELIGWGFSPETAAELAEISTSGPEPPNSQLAMEGGNINIFLNK